MIYRQLLEGQCEIDNRRRSGTAIVLMSRLYARAISPPKLALTCAKTTPPGLSRRQYTWFLIRAAPADEIGGRLKSQRAQCTDESPDGVRIGETTAARRKVVLLSQLCPVSCKLTHCHFHLMALPPPEATYCGHDNEDAWPGGLDFAGLVKPGDCVAWGQAGAEALPLTQAPRAALPNRSSTSVVERHPSSIVAARRSMSSHPSLIGSRETSCWTMPAMAGGTANRRGRCRCRSRRL
jgi:hypothetical protein